MCYTFAIIAILADGATESTAISGWAGAGLLSGVLSWLLFVHLPTKDKQLKEFLTERNDADHQSRSEFIGEIKEIRAHYTAREDKLRDVSKQALDAVLQHCDKEAERRDKEAERRDKTMQVELGALSDAIQSNVTVMDEIAQLFRRPQLQTELQKIVTKPGA